MQKLWTVKPRSFRADMLRNVEEVMAEIQQRRRSQIITIGAGLLIALLLLFGCGSPLQDAPVAPDTIGLARTPILLTSEARAEATADALGTQGEVFGGRIKAGAATEATATPGQTGQPSQEAEQLPTVDAIAKAQLTEAPTVAAFLTRVASIAAEEGTPSPPSGCPGGCPTYPVWCEPPVKGIVSAGGGERFYYLPGDDVYEVTIVEPDNGDYYFCTPDEAEAAGFRRWSN